MIDSILDKMIIFSFDRSGFLRHKKRFDEDLSIKNLSGKTVLVTGATGGIGAAVLSFLAGQGASVYFTGRNQRKGKTLEERNKNSKFVSLDMAAWKDLNHFAKDCEIFDLIVFNAGSMPENLSVTEQGVEFQCASQLVGHYHLLSCLQECQKIKTGARLVWVSSGGMYLKKLDLASLFENDHYEKVGTYANVKRAQVTLVEELAKNELWSNYYIYSMHPGWVKTEGLKEALPKFYSLLKNRLRTPQEGADTILWLLLSLIPKESGGFYFDREKVSPYLSKKYIPSKLERIELIERLDELRRIV